MPPETIPEDEFEKIITALEEVTELELASAKNALESGEPEQGNGPRKLTTHRESISENPENDSKAEAVGDLSQVVKSMRGMLKSQGEDNKDGSRGSAQNTNNSRMPSRENASASREKRLSITVEKLKLSASVLRKGSLFSRESAHSIPDPTLLHSWYHLDTNCIPPVYRLQKIR